MLIYLSIYILSKINYVIIILSTTKQKQLFIERETLKISDSHQILIIFG